MAESTRIDRFIEDHRLPASFRDTAGSCYLPLVEWIRRSFASDRPALLGISGAQGTGKSTLTAFLADVLEDTCGWRVAVLSLDDFYLTKDERRKLAQDVHPLLATRGVPGTHDAGLLRRCLARLMQLEAGAACTLPRFDKARDDRCDAARWPTVNGPLDLVILEGWCVGSVPVPAARLAQPVNALERDRDPSGSWRRYVNDRLAGEYAAVFAPLDALVFLRAPDFDAICRWRLEQEEKLAAMSPPGADGVMDEREIRSFIQFFERITRDNLASMPARADVVLELNAYHGCAGIRFRD